MVSPDYFFAEVGDIETDFAHTINIRVRVPPIVIFFYGCVPIVIEGGLKVRGTFVPLMRVVKVPAYVTICHYIPFVSSLKYVSLALQTLSTKLS